MTMHLKLTIMILFANIILAIMYPAQVLGTENGMFYEDSNGDYQLNTSLTGSVGNTVNKEGGLPKGIYGLTDIISLIWDFVVMTFKILFSSFVLLTKLDGVWRLLIGIPLVIAYLFALMGWVK